MYHTQIATITSKRQLTLPSVLFRQAKLKEGQKVRVVFKDGRLFLDPMVDLVEELAGSVSVPQRFKSLSVDQIVSRAKKGRFK